MVPVRCFPISPTARRYNIYAMLIPAEWPNQLKGFVNEWKTGRLQGDDGLGDNPFGRFVLTHTAFSWDDILVWLSDLDASWCFRGQRESSWDLHTSLDRAVKRERRTENSHSIWHLDRETELRNYLDQFRRNVAFLPIIPPPTDDFVSWYALMQHYGAPTPYLDWTESPFIALYFAIESEAMEYRQSAALWAIDSEWIQNRAGVILRGRAASEDENVRPVIVRVTPRNLNKRMQAQQGVLLHNLRRGATFNQILMSMAIHPDVEERPVVRKLEIGNRLRVEFLEQLKLMGITHSSLFPDDN
jgi:hypothetical protein